MTPAVLLRQLTDRGVALWAEGDRLRYRAPKGSLSATDLEALRANNPALLALLSNQPADLAEALEADYENLSERAAIMEYDGGLSREEAEYRALGCTRCRCWRLTLDDRSTLLYLAPEAVTVADFRPPPTLADRLTAFEPVALALLLGAVDEK